MRRLAGLVGVLALTLACVTAAVASSQPELQRVLDTALGEQPVSPGMTAAVDRAGLRWHDLYGGGGLVSTAGDLNLATAASGATLTVYCPRRKPAISVTVNAA